jgi:malto-oligosyltrehalose trehalohydrolase
LEEYTFGPLVLEDGVEFRIWAPLVDDVSLQIKGRHARAMERTKDGWYKTYVSGLGHGSHYSFVLPDGSQIPDPASRYQPDDVHGPSEVVALRSFPRTATGWSGRPWEEMVIYELHVGSFTVEGTFCSAIRRLDHLVVLGITAIQIMPISDFPGRYNWGYDGVLPYAPDSSYGRPEDFMALIDAAHERGMNVFLDVVYNHFGPEGNYLSKYAPLFTSHHKTPWGDGINYDGEGSKTIREFVIQNAIYWIKEFRLDGLRLDAVHAIKDNSEEHLLDELARRVRQSAGARRVHLIVENEDNDSDLLRRDKEGVISRYAAQWNDDVHHVLHIAATGEKFGYYRDYADDASNVGKALVEGFVFQGDHMPYRGCRRGKPSAGLPPSAFISFILNHDQIGNRAHGDRMITYSPIEAIKAVTAVYLLSPQIPMLFMGEEWGAREPFPYFCAFNSELDERVRVGRREELSRLPGFDADELPDPTAWSTFAASKLDWSRLDGVDASEMLKFYKEVLALRHKRIVPLIKDRRACHGSFRLDGSVTTARWVFAAGPILQLQLNFSDHPANFERPTTSEEVFRLGTASIDTLDGWSVSANIGQVSQRDPRSPQLTKIRRYTTVRNAGSILGP